LRVVVDANVCVSAVLSARGNPAKILDHALGEGPYDFELCAPSQLFSKIEEVLARPKVANRLRWGPAEIGVYARRLRLAVTEVPTGDPEKIPSYTGDPEDDPYVQTAVLVGAAYIVSGDDDVLGMGDPPVQVLGPAQFVRLWEARLL
jgi:putative PIN family toxin of toxin-antitoxin system